MRTDCNPCKQCSPNFWHVCHYFLDAALLMHRFSHLPNLWHLLRLPLNQCSAFLETSTMMGTVCKPCSNHSWVCRLDSIMEFILCKKGLLSVPVTLLPSFHLSDTPGSFTLLTTFLSVFL